MIQQEMWKDVMAAVTVGKEIGEKTPARGGDRRTRWETRVTKFEEVMAVANEALEQAMVWMARTVEKHVQRVESKTERAKKVEQAMVWMARTVEKHVQRVESKTERAKKVEQAMVWMARTVEKHVQRV